MSNKKKVHYNIDLIDSKGAMINIIYGERSNGKSYQAKHKKGIFKYLYDTENYVSSYKNKNEIIKESIKKGSRFILMRRLKEEITTDKIEAYFQDIDVNTLTDGKYNCIIVYRKQLFLAHYNYETNKTAKGEKIGYVVALSTEQNYAGGSYLDVTDIIFEEFMSRGTYLNDEPNKLMNFYSTVDRKRGTTKLWLVGNSISRVCPYIEDWDLHYLISHQKQGEILTKWLDTGDIDKETGLKIEVKLAIEFCKSTGRTSFAIGSHKNMLNEGSWQSDPQPLLPKSKNNYIMMYRIGFQYKSFKFIGEYLRDKENRKNVCWFVYPYDKEFKNKILIFSDSVQMSKYWQRDIYNITIKNERVQNILNTFRESNIFYANDLIGTDFKQVIDFNIRR